MNNGKDNSQLINEKKLLTESESAEILNISLSSLRNLRKSGLISYIQLSDRTIRYSLGQIEDFKSQRIVTAA